MKGPVDEFFVLALAVICLTAIVASPTTSVIGISVVVMVLAGAGYVALQRVMRKRRERK